MNVSEIKSEGLLREYQIVITAAEIDAEVTKKLAEIAATVKIPGFRPGKIAFVGCEIAFWRSSSRRCNKSGIR